MTAKKIELIAPNDKNIKGILLADGSVCPVVFMYDSELLAREIILQEMHPAPIFERNEGAVYVDEDGKHWESLDVEYHSVLHSSK